jgi:hypothetical protein
VKFWRAAAESKNGQDQKNPKAEMHGAGEPAAFQGFGEAGLHN